VRTTLTLDDDVAALLEKALKRRGATLKQVVNEALRRGLTEDAPRRRAARYRIRPVDLGGARVPLDNIGEVLALIEGETYK
jgi:hypothetical protein